MSYGICMVWCLAVLLTWSNVVRPSAAGKLVDDRSLRCTMDADCVPSSCCHATSCIRNSSPTLKDCSDVLCNAVCKPFTLDCGGECRCVNQNCTSVIRSGRSPPGVEFKAPTEQPKGFAYVKVKRVVSVPRSQARAIKSGKMHYDGK
mmetsp:Transcript_28518/g.32970  ORF Transcript_28518/g.32970 Transcript_28518/m.32970 type:complete len:147 (-) Transcript_28518:220-660(-)